MSVFLLIIIFGHSLQDLGASTAGMRDWALMNFAAVLVILYAGRKEDRFSLNRFFPR